MHGLMQFCIASHALLRSARAPLPQFSDRLARDGHRRPVNALSRNHRPGASQPPRLCLLPAPRRLYVVFYRRLLAIPDGRSGSDPVESQICKNMPAQACVV
eukprot:6004237-Pleurochrysis_carterae.AAC.1